MTENERVSAQNAAYDAVYATCAGENPKKAMWITEARELYSLLKSCDSSNGDWRLPVSYAAKGLSALAPVRAALHALPVQLEASSQLEVAKRAVISYILQTDHADRLKGLNNNAIQVVLRNGYTAIPVDDAGSIEDAVLLDIEEHSRALTAFVRAIADAGIPPVWHFLSVFKYWLCFLPSNMGPHKIISEADQEFLLTKIAVLMAEHYGKDFYAQETFDRLYPVMSFWPDEMFKDEPSYLYTGIDSLYLFWRLTGFPAFQNPFRKENKERLITEMRAHVNDSKNVETPMVVCWLSQNSHAFFGKNLPDREVAKYILKELERAEKYK